MRASINQFESNIIPYVTGNEASARARAAKLYLLLKVAK